MKLPIEIADDLLEMLVVKALTENRSVDNWMDTHLRTHFYGEAAMLPETNEELPARTRRDVSARRRAQVYRLSEGKCHYCKATIDPFYWDCDHVVPLCAGGTNDIKNLVASCPECNAAKSRSSAEEFQKRRDGNAA